ncbi:MAG: glycosyltransferase family 39 protein, partial [Patescibacteria group bacterium]
VYYLLLHLWMLLFGRSEIALRGLSILAFLLFLLVVYKFALVIFKDKKAAVYTACLMAANPMLLYFAFEIRMYSLLTMLATLSMYFLYTNNWIGYIISASLGMYTQPFMAFVILAQNSYLLLTGKFRIALRNDILLGLLYLPWMPILFTQFKASGPMWMYPIDLNLLAAVLGNLYVGYEGTPGFIWPYVQGVSLFILLAALFLWKAKINRSQTLLWLTWIFIPLFLVLGISLIKPIYVHRYVIFVTVAEVFLISAFMVKVLPQTIKWRIAYAFLITIILIDFVAVAFHRKVPIRDTFTEIKSLLKAGDVVYAETPLVFYESLYYAPPYTNVYLYNPQKITPPRYVGSVGMPQAVWATESPSLPQRAFVISEDGSYYIAPEKKL